MKVLIKNSLKPSSKIIIALCYIYAIILTTLVWIVNAENPLGFAIISMAIGLFFLWGICFAFIMYKIKDKIKAFFVNNNIYVFLIVTLGGIFLALVEEVFSTLMTNMAPLFGFSPYVAYITASPDYIEVVTQHSVIVFIPWFIAWGIILSKYTIHPNDVMILFGITGVLAESLSFGLQNLLQFGFWVIIYGLMIYLPAYIVYDPKNKYEQKEIRKLHYPLLIILPFLVLILWAGIFSLLLIVVKA